MSRAARFVPQSHRLAACRDGIASPLSACLLISMLALTCDRPSSVSTVVSLMDHVPSEAAKLPWATLACETSPVRLARGAVGLTAQGGELRQAADTSTIVLRLAESIGGTIVVQVAYTTPLQVFGTVEVQLRRGNSVITRSTRPGGSRAETFRMECPPLASGRLAIVHHLPAGTPLHIAGIAAGAVAYPAHEVVVERLIQWLDWHIRDRSAYDRRRGLPASRVVPLSIDGYTRSGIVMFGGDSLAIPCPLPGRGVLRLWTSILQGAATLSVDVHTPSGWHNLRGGIAPAKGWSQVEMALPGSRGAADSVRFALSGREGLIAVAEPVLLRLNTPSARRNLLVIMLDTLRSDRLGCYGYHARPTSTRLDSIMDAKGFAIFSRARAAASYTLPSVIKLMTSRYLNEELSVSGSSLARAPAVLAEVLRSQGYYCTAFTGGAVLRNPGFERGFHEYHWSQGLGKIEDSFPQAADWLRRADRPFFMFLHTYETHLPYTRTTFCEGMPRGSLPDPAGQGGFRHAAREILRPTSAESLYIQALYDSTVRTACDAVADLFALMDSLDLWRSTAVIVLSDHGEEFWDHFDLYATHGQSLYGELVNVPLMVYSPADRALGRVDTEVSLVDVFPTVIDMLQLVWHGTTDGVSLRPLLRGEKISRSTPILANLHSPAPWRVTCLFSDSLKYIEVERNDTTYPRRLFPGIDYPRGRELYRVSEDPREHVNLVYEEPDLVMEMTQRLRSALRNALPAIVSDDAHGPRATMDLSAQLKALGYTE